MKTLSTQTADEGTPPGRECIPLQPNKQTIKNSKVNLGHLTLMGVRQ